MFRNTVDRLASRYLSAYLVIRFGVVVQGQHVVQEDVELWRHVFEQHPMVVTLFNLTHLFLENIEQQSQLMRIHAQFES